MKASVYTRYGSPEVLQLVDIPKPTPRDHEVLVKVHATTVTIGDTIMRSFKLSNITGWQKFMARLILGWNKPKRHILGMELSGEIESIGRKVTRFKPGDAVFASTYDVNFGGHAEYKCLPEKGVIALKPGNLTFEEAAAIPGGGARSPLWRQILADILQWRLSPSTRQKAQRMERSFGGDRCRCVPKRRIRVRYVCEDHREHVAESRADGTVSEILSGVSQIISRVEIHIS